MGAAACFSNGDRSNEYRGTAEINAAIAALEYELATLLPPVRQIEIHRCHAPSKAALRHRPPAAYT